MTICGTGLIVKAPAALCLLAPEPRPMMTIDRERETPGE